MNALPHRDPERKVSPTTLTRSNDEAFSRADLLAIIAIMALLALVLTPALARNRVGDKGFQCLNNLRQLMSAMLMYTQDYRDLFPPNPDDGNTTPYHNWCSGQAGQGGAQEFNSDLLKD